MLMQMQMHFNGSNWWVQATMIQAAEGRVIVHTGAGISTAAGVSDVFVMTWESRPRSLLLAMQVSDFRGPNGIWTKEQQRRRKTKCGPAVSMVGISAVTRIPCHR